MINHVWGLMTHPNQEWKQIDREGETVSHFYLHHVLLMALVPVVCAYIGTTTNGWGFGNGNAIKVSPDQALVLGIIFYAMIIGAVALMGRVLHRLAKGVEHNPGRTRCTIFAGYIATPMFLSGLMGLYPVIWLCLLAGTAGLCYTAYLLYRGIPNFLGISEEEGFIISNATLAIGVLVLEAMLATTVLLWSYGPALAH